MATKIEVKVHHDFCTIIDIEECKSLIRALVADLAVERTSLEQAMVHPAAIDDATIKLFGLGPNHQLNTLDMAKSRVSYMEDAQDRLWEWYRRLSSGEAGQAGA